jgi:20S proteasome alpha/beta subunit
MTPGCEIDDSWERRWGIPEWEPRNMTICIAAICDAGQTIVTAADREYGVGFTSGEFDDPKIMPLFGKWSIAIAGKVAESTEVMGAIRSLEKAPSGDDGTPLDIMAMAEKGYRKVRLAKAEGSFLATRGWSLDDFRQFGAQRMPPTTYGTIDAQFSLFDLGVELLIAGFDRDQFASVLTVKNPGMCVDHSKLGFWCIGSGATLAQTSMFARNYSLRWSVEKAAYSVYEAKKIAERATGVGPETDIIVIRRSKMGGLSQDAKKMLEEIYQELQPKEFSPDHWGKLSALSDFSIIRNAS